MDPLNIYSAPVAYTAEEAEQSFAELNALVSGIDDPLNLYFDWTAWDAHHGVDPAPATGAPDGFGALNPSDLAYLDAHPQFGISPFGTIPDASNAALDALMPAPARDCGEASRDHVPSSGPVDGGAQPLCVRMADVCDLPPPVIPDFSTFWNEAEDEEETTGFAAYDSAPEGDDFFARMDSEWSKMPPIALAFPDLPWASGETTTDPTTATLPAQARIPKRKRDVVADADVSVEPTKKTRYEPATVRRPQRVRSSAPSPSPATVHVPLPAPALASVPTPIVVSPPGGLRCPMPLCNVLLPAKDAAWRSHFRLTHHADVCADAHSGCPGDCKRTCPLPRAGGCGDGEKCGASPMAVDSIGRHLLNVHVGLKHKCPVCGVEKAQRHSACQRHILTCLEKARARRE